MYKKSILVGLFSFLFFISSASAQIDRATLEGTVTDSTGATIAGAKVRIVEIQTGISAEKTTSTEGYYRFAAMAIGRCDVTASNQGFKTKTIQAVGLQVGQTRTLDIRLEVGGTKENIDIRADAVPEELSSAESSDIVYNGYDVNDWKTWDTETAVWRRQNIPVYPAFGNHDLHGDPKVALANYFQRFPELEENRYYSVRAANTVMLVLDSSLAEVAGPQGQWLADKLDNIPADVDFIFVVLHHPPYTSSSDEKVHGGGHSARSPEQALATMLEQRQPHIRSRLVVTAGHVHNYERHEKNGITYFVTGGAEHMPTRLSARPMIYFPIRT